MKLRQQLDGAQQDSLISRIASNPLERHKRMTENLPLSDQNRESEIRQSNSEKIKNGNQQNGVHTAQDIHSSHQARHTAPTLPTTTTSFPTSLSAIPTFSIFEDEDKKTEKETDKSLTFSATSFQIFEDKEGENEKKKNEVLGGSALERMRNKEKERKTERDKERERENVREREKERERESVTQRERDRKAEEQSAQNKRMKTKSAHNNSDLDAMLLEMGVGDSEDGTINTRLAR